MPSVVVVEDEADIARALADRLRSEGFDVHVASDGPSGVDLVARSRPDVVVLDLMLPGMDGLDVCRAIRADRPYPVIMLTARDSESDVLVGLGAGADDYVTKPFSPRELVARVKALLRRVELDRGPEPEVLGDVRIDAGGRTVELRGQVVHLTPTEFDLLVALVQHRGTVLSRERLLREVWGIGGGVVTRTVDSHVRSLRRKLGEDVIRTVHGVGYACGM